MSSKKKKKPDYTIYEDRTALCPHFDLCGGCSMQKISYENQLKIKSDGVKMLLGLDSDDPQDNSSDIFEGIFSSPMQEGYRNKMEFTFGDESKGGKFSLGLHMRGSFMNIVNITDCHLVHRDLNLIKNCVRDYFAPFYENGFLSFRNNKTQIGYLRHLLLRRAHNTGQILIGLVTTSQFPSCSIPDSDNQEMFMTEDSILDRLKQILIKLQLEGEISGILHIVNDSEEKSSEA